MLLDHDTIAAISTPIGRGAIAIIRVSGDDAHRIGRLLFDRWPVEPRRTVLVSAVDVADGSLLDQGLVTRFEKGHSYTGEPMFEFSGHGGVTAPTAVLGAVLRCGARQARPGEFTQRALLNNKLDLVQAEGIGELIDAQTDAHRRIAVSQIQGGLSTIVERLQTKLVALEALIAYDLDFPEEDDGPVPRDRIRTAATDVLREIDSLLETVAIGEIAKGGALVVIAGRPNAGKSSLFNALLGEERAIVTEHPGTTRDAIEAILDHAQIPLRLIDTAGLREMSDSVERLGIEISKRHLARAHVVLACADRPEDVQDAMELVRLAGASAPVIGVLTKSELVVGKRLGTSDGVIAVSAVRRTGLSELLETIRGVVRMKLGEIEVATPVVTRVRQQVALTNARTEVKLFLEAWEGESLPAVIAAVHVRSALHSLQELVGRIDVETILGVVFERFCVGK